MRENRLQGMLRPLFLAVSLAGILLAPGSGSAALATGGEAPQGEEVLTRGNVRMTRRATEPGTTREAPLPARRPEGVAKELSEERIAAGGGSRWLLDELVVGYRKGTTRKQKDQLRLDHGLQRISWAREKLPKLEVERVGLPSLLDTSGLEQLIGELRAEPVVEYVEPNFVTEEGGSGPRTTADLADAILYGVDHGADEIDFPFAGLEQVRVVRDALAYARRNAAKLRGDRREPAKVEEMPPSSDAETELPAELVSATSASSPAVSVYTSKRCGELVPFLRKDAVVRVRVALKGRHPLDELKAVQQSGAHITHLVYRWNDHSTTYPVRPGENLALAADGLKALRERFVVRQIESIDDLVAEFRPMNEEEERFHKALGERLDDYRREREDLAKGVFRIDAVDVFAPGMVLRVLSQESTLTLGRCTFPGTGLLVEPSNPDFSAKVGRLLASEKLREVEEVNQDSPAAPSQWSPSMGVHRIDLRDSASPKTLKSFFWWNDKSGFRHPHLYYEHDIRITDWDFLECDKTWLADISDLGPVHEAQWLDVFWYHVSDRVWRGPECSKAAAVHSNLGNLSHYVDVRLYDRKEFGKIFTIGISDAQEILAHHLYEISFDVRLDSSAQTGALIFQPQLGHWHSDYSGGDTGPLKKSIFCSLSDQFCRSPSCAGEEAAEQACVFTSDYLTVINPPSWNIRKGEVTTLVWSVNIGLYGKFSESKDQWVGCRSDDTSQDCQSVVGHIQNESTDRIRQVYNGFARSRDNGTYQCNKLGVPFDDGGGEGVYVHDWNGVWIQNFKHPAGTECERFGNDGETAIIYNPRLDEAFLLRDGMWEKYRSGNGPLLLGPPTSNEAALPGVGARQTFEKGCLIFFSSTGRVEERSGSACASDPVGIDFRFAEIGGLRVQPNSNRVELLLRLREAGLATAAQESLEENTIDLDDKRPELTKTFFQALAIPNHKHRIDLEIVGSGGRANVPSPFERTDMADAFLHADVAMKLDLFGESNLTRETEIWTNLVRQSPYWSELQSKGFEDYPTWIIAATIIPGEVTATQTENRIMVEDVELDLQAGWWKQQPALDLSGYSLSTGARNDLLQRLATYKTTLENIVKDYARNVVVPEMNRTENLDPRYKRLKSIYSTIALAQWYKERILQNPRLPFAFRRDSENLTGIDKGTPFDQAYWDGQANQVLWSGPCTAFWGTAECEIFGGLELADSEPAILGGLRPDQEEILNVVLDELGSVEEGDTHYVYGDLLTAPSAELSVSEISFLPGAYLVGRPVTLRARILNTGIVASGAFLVTVYDDAPGTQGPVRHLVGQVTLSLAPREATTASFPWMLPSIAGEHSFTVVVDATQVVAEANESDNNGLRKLDVRSTSPTAVIQFPVEGSTFASSDEIPFFAGEGTDPEEGELPADRLAWSSSVDGLLGTGPVLEEITLSSGEHTITLTVSDSEGLSSTDEAHIEIDESATRRLTVTKDGDGGAGTVTSDPAGIDCGSTCSAAFPREGVVTLTATPEAGAIFAGWSLPSCPGTGPCDVLLTEDQEVTATFSLEDVCTGGWKAVGPYTGEIHSLAVDPAQPNVVYAGTSKMLFKSMDGGMTWNEAGLGGMIYSLDLSLSSTVFAGTSNGIYKSLDGGETWTASGSLGASALAVDPRPPVAVYAGVFGTGVFKSSDGGATWQLLGHGSSNTFIRSLIVNPVDPSIVYVGLQGGGVVRTADGGAHWTPVSSGLSSLDVRALAVDPVAPSTIYAATFSGIHKTSDAGLTWQNVLGLNTVSVAVSAADPATVYAGDVNGRTWKSADGGVSWRAVFDRSRAGFVWSLAADPENPAVVYIGTFFQGVFKTSDGGTVWTGSSMGLDNGQISALALAPSSTATLFSGASDGSVFQTTNSGLNWTSVRDDSISGPIFDLAVGADPSGAPVLYTATAAGVFRRGSDGAWTNISGSLSGESVQCLAIDPQNPAILYAGTAARGLFKSSNAGGSWVSSSAGLGHLSVKTLVIDPNLPSTLYAYAGSVNAGSVYKSVDAGEHWVPSNSGLPGAEVKELAVAPWDSSKVYAVTFTNGVYRSLNSGTSWAKSSTGLTPVFNYSIEAHPTVPGTLYVGTENGGVFKSIDAGTTWTPWNQGLPIDGVSEIVAAPTEPKVIYAGTSGRSVYRLTECALTDQPLDFFTVAPCRVLDTRSGAPLTSQSVLEFPVAGLCGVPSSAEAVSINITVVAPVGAGHLTLWPAGLAKPVASAINFSAGQVRANNMVLPLAANGSGTANVEALVGGSGTVHLVVDVSGYFQ